MLEIVENLQGKETRILRTARVLETRAKWPTLLGAGGNETDEKCHFQLELKPGASPDIVSSFNAAAGIA